MTTGQENLIIPRFDSQQRARGYQPTAGFAFTCPQTVLKDQPSRAGVMFVEMV